MFRVKPVSISIVLSFCFPLLAGCETIIYWEKLPPLKSPKVVRIAGDNEAITRALIITQRLVNAAPLPASAIFVMTLTHFRTKIHKSFDPFDHRARTFRCAPSDEESDGTGTPSSGCIVVPEEYLDRLSNESLAAVIAHELGHIEKGHKSWQGTVEPTLAQWEADEAAVNRLYLAGYCAGETLRKAGKELASIYARGATHPWEHYPADCQPKEHKGRAIADAALMAYQRGLSYYEKKDYDRAIDTYGEAIRMKSDYALAYYNRGRAYYSKREYDQALADFNRATELNPNYASAFSNRGLVYHAKRNYELAIQDYDRAIALSPNYAAAFNNRGNAYRAKRDYDRAIQDYDEAIRLTPNYALAFNNRARAYNAQGRHDRALSDHESAARIEPQSADYLRIGRQLFYLGRFPESAEATIEALKSSPQNRYAILWRYLARARSGAIQAAAKELAVNAAKLTEQRWPDPVIDFFLGKIDQTAIFAAADSADPKVKGEQLCEANFYAGQAKILSKSWEDAIAELRAAEKDCPPTFIEAYGARAELKRLNY